jgi:POT family proton-dependent oligopeptide transporter
MSDNQDQTGILRQTFNEVTTPFKDLFKTSKALFGINLSYLFEGLTYFGMLTLLALFFNQSLKLTDIQASPMVGFLTGGITIAMLFLGATVDFMGIRKALLIALSTMMVGRIIVTLSPLIGGDTGMWSNSHLIAMGGIVGIIIGYGIYQPACYTAVKKLTNAKTSAMGFAMLYALMNLGGFLPGFISPPVRDKFGITGVFWVYVLLTFTGILIVLFLLTKATLKKALDENNTIEIEEKETKSEAPLKQRIFNYAKRFPYNDYRFLFFIFILIPVQTLFAHNWLTLPQYCSRAFSGVVSEYFEFFVNLNPIFIFILTPAIAALTSKKHTYKMMIYGTIVMASAPFLLVLGPNTTILMLYIIVLTIGEAMWQPRFLQWVAEIAPKDMTGIYMGLGQFPWFLTKVLTSFYSGWFLTKYCPTGVPPQATQTEFMWLIYGIIAIASPVGLILARKWMLKGFKEQH